MIPRTARKLESSFLSVSRQALPRPARYSTPSKRVNAPALATASAPAPDFPAFMTTHGVPNAPALDMLGESSDLESFLRRRAPLTMLPTPLPEDQSSPMAALNLSDSSTLDQLAAVDACLHNLHDVVRGKEMFDRLRATHLGDPALGPKLYNTVLKAYLGMAEKEAAEGKATTWLDELSLLFDSMYTGTEQIKPAPGSYAVMLLAWHK
jgi:DNA-directed RNA polymerase, mitochondrial